MNIQRRAESILEYVTANNCIIDEQGSPSYGNTRSHLYFCPKELKRWDEFDFATVEQIYGGKLMKELRSKDRHLPDYPRIWPFECKISEENPTVSILNKWNHAIVTAALMAVEHTLHPSVWRQTTGKTNWSMDFKNQRRLRPDAGAIALCEVDVSEPVERLPKDYKVGAKWDSKVMLDKLIDDAGMFRRGKRNNDGAMPLRQAYTYCIVKGCRYGCIISVREAFLFRIRPRKEVPDLPGQAHLEKSVREDGLMEYVSIPWARGFDAGHGEATELTINLALFVLHTLAGNSHHIDWRYPSLAEEELTPQPCDHGSRISKRKATEDLDTYELSFVRSEPPVFPDRDDESVTSTQAAESQQSLRSWDTVSGWPGRRYSKRLRSAAKF